MDPAPVVVDSATAAKPAFKVADHQVAGHRFEDGRVGSLIDDSGRFYKPLQDGARGDKEVLFYNRLWSDKSVPPAVQKFFPKFYGTIDIDTPNASGSVRHAIMEDLTHGFHKPGIMDVKEHAHGIPRQVPNMSRSAKAEYFGLTVGAHSRPIKNVMIGYALDYLFPFCFVRTPDIRLKDKETTTEALGYRLSGMQVYEAKSGEVWKASRSWCKYLKPEAVPEALKRFVSSNPSAEKGWDGAFAKAVYGPTLTELQQLKAWLEVQTTYHFFSASVLLVFEGEPTSPQAVSVRLVDFAHVLYDRDAIDENFLSGLNAFMKVLADIIDSVTKIET